MLPKEYSFGCSMHNKKQRNKIFTSVTYEDLAKKTGPVIGSVIQIMEGEFVPCDLLILDAPTNVPCIFNCMDAEDEGVSFREPLSPSNVASPEEREKYYVTNYSGKYQYSWEQVFSCDGICTFDNKEDRISFFYKNTVRQGLKLCAPWIVGFVIRFGKNSISTRINYTNATGTIIPMVKDDELKKLSISNIHIAFIDVDLLLHETFRIGYLLENQIQFFEGRTDNTLSLHSVDFQIYLLAAIQLEYDILNLRKILAYQNIELLFSEQEASESKTSMQVLLKYTNFKLQEIIFIESGNNIATYLPHGNRYSCENMAFRIARFSLPKKTETLTIVLNPRKYKFSWIFEELDPNREIDLQHERETLDIEQVEEYKKLPFKGKFKPLERTIALHGAYKKIYYGHTRASDVPEKDIYDMGLPGENNSQFADDFWKAFYSKEDLCVSFPQVYSISQLLDEKYGRNQYIAFPCNAPLNIECKYSFCIRKPSLRYYSKRTQSFWLTSFEQIQFVPPPSFSKRYVLDISSFNEWMTIPRSILCLLQSGAYQELILSDSINELPSQLGDLDFLTKVTFNPSNFAQFPPKYVTSWKYLKQYLGMINSHANWNRCRLLIVGQEAVGKVNIFLLLLLYFS